MGEFTEVKKLVSPEPRADERFGYSVAVSGDLAVVGAPGFDRYAGCAYLYHRNKEGTDKWGFVKRMTATYSGGIPFDGNWTGVSVATNGKNVLVGAPGFTKTSATSPRSEESGTAYLFHSTSDLDDPEKWKLRKQITPADSTGQDYF